MKPSRIPIPAQEPPDPSNYECEWCGDQATRRFERLTNKSSLKTQQYVFTCDKHQEQGRKSIEKKPRQPRI